MRTTCSSISTLERSTAPLFSSFSANVESPHRTRAIRAESVATFTMTEGTANKWSIEEREKILSSGTLDQRKAAFKDDEELMKETLKFVNEVIDTATTEASKRKQHPEGSDVHEGTRLKGTGSIAGWYHRGRGFCNRILNALCPCFNSAEGVGWSEGCRLNYRKKCQNVQACAPQNAYNLWRMVNHEIIHV